MTSRLSERKKKEKSSIHDQGELATFKLPESLHCSEVDFPILVKRIPKANWSEILKESEKNKQEIDEYVSRKNETVLKSYFLKTETEYIQNQVFKQLLPALEETLDKAKMWNALQTQKCFFNGIDHIVQVLWNNNPRYPHRKKLNLNVFNMPWVQKFLQQNPRPYFPKSWLWPEDYAATVIQKSVRQYFVQREEEVQEMRDFWRKLEIERVNPQIDTNPFLAKKFASLRDIHKKI